MSFEPQIRYAPSSDGVNIAFWTIGDGPAIVHMPLVFSHIRLEWDIPECQAWYRRLADGRRLIRFDQRGMGLSDRVAQFSLEADARDLEAVADRLELKEFALIGSMHSAQGAVAFAAMHPERVSHLILWCAYSEAAEWSRSPAVQAVRSLMDYDWEFYTEAVSRVLLGWSVGDPACRFSELVRESISQERLRGFIDEVSRFDTRDLLGRVQAPTLVLQRRGYRVLGVDTARALATRIPEARLVLLDGELGAPYLGDSESVVRAINEFLGRSAVMEERSVSAGTGTAVILFADIVDSTVLTERLGDAAFRERARELDSGLRGVIRENGGTPIEGKLLGDGVLAVFNSARQAIEAALVCSRVSEEAGLPVHLGLHAGDVISEDNNIFGGAVNIAARISGLSAAGQVLVSDIVRGLARTSGMVTFEDRGEQALKGVSEPVRVYEVRWRE